MSTKFDTRQNLNRSALPMIGSAANDTLDTILVKIDNETAKLFEDRNVQLIDGGLISFLGTSVQFTQPLKLHINSKVAGGAPVIIDLASTTRTISADGKMIYAVINRTAGTATVTDDASTLPAVTSANQEVFLIAKRVDSPDGVKRLYFRNGSAFNEGQSARLGSAGSGSGSGAGLGDDLGTLTFKASVSDTFAELSTDSTTSVDYGTNKTPVAALSVVNQLIRLNYDAGKTATAFYTFTVTSANATAGATYTNNGVTFTVVSTIAASTTLVMTANGLPVATSGTLTKVTGTGDATITFSAVTYVTMKLSAAPAFTVAVGDMLINQVSGDVRRITNIGSINTDGGVATPFTIESTFPVNLNAQLATVSQAVYTKDLNAFAGDGLAASTAFSTNISQILVNYEDTTTASDTIFDANTTPVIGFSASSDGTSFSTLAVRSTNLSDSMSLVNLPTSSTNLYLRFVANKSSGSGAVNLLNYKAFFHRDASFTDGNLLNQAYCFTDGTGTEINCANPSVVSGKTRVQTTFSFPVGVNSGTTNGTLSVYLNGQKIPRFVDSTLTPDAFYKEIDQRTIELDSDYSGFNYSLEIVQDVAVVDNIDTNSTAINQLQEINTQGFQAFVNENARLSATTATGTPAPGTFYSSIVNRASIPDLTANLKVQMGIERLMTQQVYQLQNEFGPNGEPVFGVVNDDKGLIRFVGGNIASYLNTSGSGILINGDFVEIVFYGTGLNILNMIDGAARTFNYQVDGGSATTGTYPASASNLLTGRNYAGDQVLVGISGLSLGIHTVKITSTSAAMVLYGVELLNESSTLKVNPGSSYANGKKLTLSSQQSPAYNSGFESGTLGTRGGRVVVYQKSDGTIAKAVQPVDAASATLSSTNHINEEVARTFHWREFGAGRADDFSLLTSSARAAAFTLDDGTTTLAGDSVVTDNSTNTLLLQNGTNNFYTFTFVGCGVDMTILSQATNNGGNIYLDGSLVSGTGDTNWASNKSSIKIASGLPYGTHTLKVQRTASNWLYAKQFIVYQPKKPTLPSGAIELADYNVMADFIVGTVGKDNIATGVLRKEGSREHVYLNSWSMNLDATQYIGGWRKVAAANSGNAVQYTFFGTGFEWRADANTAYANNLTATLAAGSGAFQNLTAANFPTAIFSVYGGITYTSPPTLVVNNSNANGSGFRCSGLPLGVYTVKITSNVATSWSSESFDIITPIHSIKSNLYADLQNTLPVGSCAISDNRKTSAIKEIIPAQKAWAQAIGVSSSSTTSTTSIPLPDMSCTIKTTGGPLKVSYSLGLYCSSQGASPAAVDIRVLVNGVQASQGKTQYWGGVTGSASIVSDTFVVPVAAGTHKVDLYWNSTNAANTVNTNGASQKNMIVEEK